MRPKILLLEPLDAEENSNLFAEKLLILGELIEASDDATLEELRYLLYQKIGVTISFGNNGKNDKTLEHDFHKKTLFPARERH